MEQKVHKTRVLEIHHLIKFFGKSFYAIPWAVLLVLYLTVDLGCRSPTTRSHLDGMCLRPYVDPNRELPWWLAYKDASADDDDTSDTLSLYSEAFMTGYLDIHNAHHGGHQGGDWPGGSAQPGPSSNNWEEPESIELTEWIKHFPKCTKGLPNSKRHSASSPSKPSTKSQVRRCKG